MNIAVMAIAQIDNGGRRLGIDRRQFTYTNHIPDKRLGQDRRFGIDRRSGLDRRNGIDRRSGKVIIIKAAKNLRVEKDRRSGIERRVVFAAALNT